MSNKPIFEKIDIQPLEGRLPSSYDAPVQVTPLIGDLLNQLSDEVNRSTKLSKEVIMKWNEFSTWLNNEFDQEIAENVLKNLSDEVTDEKLTRLTEPVVNEMVNSKLENVNEQLADTEKKAVSTVSHNIDKKTIVSFIDDDGNKKIMSILKPIFDAEEVPCTVAIITDRLDKSNIHITTSEAKELMESGWTVCSHTHTHGYLGEMTEEQNEFEIKTSKDIVNSIGGDGDILVYPFGSASDITRKITRKYSRLGVGGYNSYNKMPIDTYTLGRFTHISENVFDLNACKKVVDEAPENSWIIFYTHINYDMWLQQETVNKMHQLIQYIKSKNIDIVNVKEGLDRKSNIVDVGDNISFTKIARDGTTVANNISNTNFNSTTPIDWFPLGESRVFLTSPVLTEKGFAPFLAGILITYRVSHSFYPDRDHSSHQIFLETYSSAVYKRSWKTDTKTWDAWVTIGQDMRNYPMHHFVDGWNVYTAATPITEFKRLAITTSYFNGGGSGMPIGSGILTTYRVNRNGFDRQEVREYNGNRSWGRYIDTSGNWTNWVELGTGKTSEFHEVKPTVNPYTNASVITDFPKNIITTYFYDSRAGTGYPVTAGIVTTYRMNDDAWGKQELREYKGNGVWTRYWDGTAWAVWTKISAV